MKFGPWKRRWLPLAGFIVGIVILVNLNLNYNQPAIMNSLEIGHILDRNNILKESYGDTNRRQTDSKRHFIMDSGKKENVQNTTENVPDKLSKVEPSLNGDTENNPLSTEATSSLTQHSERNENVRIENEEFSTTYTLSNHSYEEISLFNISHSANCSMHLYQNLPHVQTPYKIYIYDLPPEFNAHLLDCMQLPNRFPGFTVDHCGYGPEWYEESGMTVRYTWQFSLDVILHHKLLYSPYRTMDPKEADVFFIPFYEAANCFCRWQREVTYEGEKLESALFSLVHKLPYYARGKPHVLTVAKIEREERSRSCMLLQESWTHNITLVGIEHDEWSRSANHRRPFIVAPYPSYGHFTQPGGGQYVQTLFHHDRRVFVFLAAGSRRTNKFRNIILDQFPNRTRQHNIDEYYEYHNISKQTRLKSVWLETQDSNIKAHRNTMHWMKNSLFCAQPAGDSPTRKSFYDAINSGCIPIIYDVDFYPHVTYPFDSVLDYGNFTVKVPSEKAGSFWEVLKEFESSPEKVKQLQDNLKQVIKWMQYSYPVDNRDHDDAVKMILDDIGRQVLKME